MSDHTCNLQRPNYNVRCGCGAWIRRSGRVWRDAENHFLCNHGIGIIVNNGIAVYHQPREHEELDQEAI